MVTETGLARIEAGEAITIVPASGHDHVETTIAEVRQYLGLTDVEKFPSRDVAMFIRQCIRLGADPYKGDIYLIPYGGKPTPVVGKDFTYAKVNKEAGDKIEYWKSGIISVFLDADGNPPSDGQMIFREANDVLLPNMGETLIGGWSEIKLRGRSEPSRYEAPMHVWTKEARVVGQDEHGNPVYETKTGKRRNGTTYTYQVKPNNWNTMGGLMIRKTARTQHAKEEFADLFSGLNTDIEIPVHPSEGAVIEVESRELAVERPAPTSKPALPREWYSHQRFGEAMREGEYTPDEVRAVLGEGKPINANSLKAHGVAQGFDDMDAYLEWFVQALDNLRATEQAATETPTDDWNEPDDTVPGTEEAPTEPPIFDQVQMWMEQTGVKPPAVVELIVGTFNAENLLAYGGKNGLSTGDDYTRHLGEKLL